MIGKGQYSGGIFPNCMAIISEAQNHAGAAIASLYVITRNIAPLRATRLPEVGCKLVVAGFCLLDSLVDIPSDTAGNGLGSSCVARKDQCPTQQHTAPATRKFVGKVASE